MTDRTAADADEHVETIVREVAAVEGVDPIELPPIADAVDPDALAVLLSAGAGEDVTVEFEYCGHCVVASSDGGVVVRDGCNAATDTAQA